MMSSFVRLIRTTRNPAKTPKKAVPTENGIKRTPDMSGVEPKAQSGEVEIREEERQLWRVGRVELEKEDEQCERDGSARQVDLQDRPVRTLASGRARAGDDNCRGQSNGSQRNTTARKPSP